MKLITASNLFPRPDRPTCGLFNLQLFQAFQRHAEVRNLCIIPDWRVWEWQRIQRWECPQRVDFSSSYHPVFYLPWVGRSLAPWFYRRGLESITSEISTADAVYTAWLFPDGVAMTELAARAGVPSWIMVQGSDTRHLASNTRRRSIQRACDQAAGVVCVAATLADQLIKGAGVAAEKLHVVPNGVDGGRFLYRDRDAARGDLHNRVDPDVHAHLASDPLLLFVGNLVEVKGLDVLIEACAVMREKRHADWSLAVVGDGVDRQALQRQCGQHGIADRVVFVGARPHDEIPLWMAAADCLVLPSRSEGMPNVLLEAMSTGCPVVATDVGACREVTAGYPAARVVPARSPRELARAISDLREIRFDRRELARRQAGRFSWDTQARTILDLIRAAS
ncbi:MAG: glycosyltransferase [Verrucomicrobia bacterium]|nr:glycosyltransferase [Verrucomicrobiota bacterium]MDA1087942.1 glycosyltransferase [Verrucomicrobiota bacterium]